MVILWYVVVLKVVLFGGLCSPGACWCFQLWYGAELAFVAHGSACSYGKVRGGPYSYGMLWYLWHVVLVVVVE